MRNNGSMVSKCTVSCVREGVLMLGTWNKMEKKTAKATRC